MPPTGTHPESHATALFALLGVLVLTLGVGFLPATWFGISPVRHTYPKIDLSQTDSIEGLAKDQNGDGIVDWGEIVTQTYGGNDDAITDAKNTKLDQETIATLNDPNNLTTSLSKNIYIASAYLKQAGATDQGAEVGIMDNLLKDAAGKLTYTTYAYKDLSIDQKETTTSIHAYGNAVGVLVKKAIDYNLGVNDVDKLDAFIKTKDANAYADLVDKRDAAASIASTLKSMSVPLSASIYHLLALNRVTAYKEMLDNILVIEKDPVRSTLAFNGYAQVTTELLRTAVLLSDYFKGEKVTFIPKEAGYVFDPSYTTPK